MKPNGSMDVAGKLTIKEAMFRIRQMGLTVGRTAHREFRINFPDGTEGTAYYTNDAQDAVDTARAMKTAAWFKADSEKA
jgi:hypothetical protein